MWPPGSAMALASFLRTTAVFSGIGKLAPVSRDLTSLSSAARPGFSSSAVPHSNGLPERFEVSSMERTCASTAAPSRCSIDSGISGASRPTTAGTPKIATRTSDTQAASVQATTFRRERRSVAPVRSSVTASRSISAASAGSRTSSRARIGLPTRPRRKTSLDAKSACNSL